MTTPTTALAGPRQETNLAFLIHGVGDESGIAIVAERALADRIIGEREARIAKLEAAAKDAERWADRLARSGPCPGCDPGDEGAEVMGAIAANLRAALEDA